LMLRILLVWISERRARAKVCDQATKSARRMPWRQEAMKDVASCDKPRGAANTL
jgi:hypothetical protein